MIDENKHPLRCETCNRTGCPFGIDAIYCTRIIPNIISRVGCASHSSATRKIPSTKPTPLCQKCPLCLVGRGCIHKLGYEKTGICNEHDAAIEQAMREKVLDELYSLAEDQIVDANQMIQENSKEGMVDISSSKHGERDYWYGKGKFIAASVFQMRIESLRNPTSEQPKEE